MHVRCTSGTVSFTCKGRPGRVVPMARHCGQGKSTQSSHRCITHPPGRGTEGPGQGSEAILTKSTSSTGTTPRGTGYLVGVHGLPPRGFLCGQHPIHLQDHRGTADGAPEGQDGAVTVQYSKP